MSLKRIKEVFGSVGASLVDGAPVKLDTKDEDAAPAPAPPDGASPWAEFWEVLGQTPPEEWDLEALYTKARGGQPVSSTPTVAIIVPTYRESEAVAKRGRLSRNAVRRDLAEHGINSVVGGIDGDSLVCRMRQRACHMMLASQATHLLFWDCDIEAKDPDCVRHMLATGHDVIAGACPFKDMSGRTVHNLYGEDNNKPTFDDKGCVEVQDAGTGFLLVSRKALLTLQQKHPELLHISTSRGDDRGAPLWALFDTAVVGGIYQSEDYYFCHLWQEAGGRAYVYPKARFVHWGEYGYNATFEEQYGLANQEA
jgi:hypothetical protein